MCDQELIIILIFKIVEAERIIKSNLKKFEVSWKIIKITFMGIES